MIRTTHQFGIALAIALALAGCSTTRVRSDVDATSSVGVCHSYSWADAPATPSSAFENPINEQRLRNAIAQRLTARGLTASAPGASGDCTVSYAMGSRETIVGNPGPRWSFGVGVGTGSGGWGNRSAASVAWGSHSVPYREGRIAVDVYRTAGHEPLWHAAADVDVSELVGANAEKRIDAAVGAIFDRYPNSGASR